MSKPLIGLTTSRFHKRSQRTVIGVNEPYTRALAGAGAIPILLPVHLTGDDLDALFPQLDGILFTGGYDVDPHRYGNPPYPKVEGIDAERDEMEIHLVQAAVAKNKPILGICRGCQVINVALGGTLYEDLYDQFRGDVAHDRHDKPRDYLSHAVDIKSDSLLVNILASSHSQVNSLHHQGVQRLAAELQVAATAPDGLVEGFEIPSHSFCLAVQWHPEELQAHEPMRRLFWEFTEACLANTKNPEG
jgi:putative glutamine amidotransferase